MSEATPPTENHGAAPAKSPAGPTIASSLGGRDNAFGFLRLLMAMLVIVDHAFPVSGAGGEPGWIWSKEQDTVGGVAVVGFFVISGYLITKSSFNTDWLQFLWRRGLRILPAYWAVLLVTALVVGPAIWLATHGHIAGYFQPAPTGPRAYVVDNLFLTINHYGIHDLFLNSTPYGISSRHDAFNGSIWTLIFEWRCYLLVLVLALFGVMRRARFLVLVMLSVLEVLIVLLLVDPKWPGRVIPWFTDPWMLRFCAIFVMGSCTALYAEKIKIDDRLGAGALLAFFASLRLGGYFLIGYPALAYVVMWLAVRLPANLRRIGAVNDYSYGTYLYGWLISQVLAFAGVQRLGFVPFTVLAMAGSYAMAFASWHLVEKRALQLKSFGPGRGVSSMVASAKRVFVRASVS
jgi:peptidoglycan/LPS O-acetylase OafA/YrhL